MLHNYLEEVVIKGGIAGPIAVVGVELGLFGCRRERVALRETEGGGVVRGFSHLSLGM